MTRLPRVAATIGLLSLATSAALAQTTIQAGTHRPPSDPVFNDLASFYASLPAVAPHPLDRTTALQLSTMPLSCMDHPQPRPNAVPPEPTLPPPVHDSYSSAAGHIQPTPPPARP